jgi:GNAT superfamily N-acetyltransferase
MTARAGHAGTTAVIRRMAPADVDAAERLRAQAGWNQTRDDWRRLLDWAPDGCFVAEVAGRVAGTVTTTRYGDVAWVGMMLVDAELRLQGLGRRLLGHALALLRGEVAVVALDATPMGRRMYDRMGFVAAYGLERREGVAARVPFPPKCRPLATEDVGRLAALDRTAVGLDRRRQLRDLIAARPSGCFLAERDGEVAGYVCTRPGAARWHIGPLVAADPTTSERLLRAALSTLAGRPVVLDTPDINPHAAAQADDHRLRPVRAFIRMSRGGSLPTADGRLPYAIAGPEIG